MMEVSELQNRLDEMFGSGARVCANLLDQTKNAIFWVARPIALSDKAILIVPLQIEYMVPYEFDSAEFDEDGKGVTFTGSDRIFSLDSRFEPAGLEDAIKAEKTVMGEEWAEVQRSDYQREVEARG